MSGVPIVAVKIEHYCFNHSERAPIGFTTPITKEQLPSALRESTVVVESSERCERNLIKNQDNLVELSAEVGRMIDDLSALPQCKRVHIFLSVQSSFAIELGRRFQEGVHKNWVIHNFNPQTNSYEWALELSQHGVKKYHTSCSEGRISGIKSGGERELCNAAN
ncbi:SAVED domain-containing protein [Endozoicomonas sp.]|uniref:SAVED domain-containing protein n=1 Tax=Endozoicomonas sp. TaxID=1892382 RepID=UPI003AF6FA49